MEKRKDRARTLLRNLVNEYEEKHAVGSLSCTIYDTAWVSLVTKLQDGKQIWLYPSSFSYVLDNQELDGGWPTYASAIDGIMNTAAGLLTLIRHASLHLQLEDLIPKDIDQRATNAENSLRQQLKSWDVKATLHVGFEVLVPSLIDLLEADLETSFEFPGRRTLMELHDQKMMRFKPALLYRKEQASALHSLEAFIGKVDFDKMKHHKRFGSMLASPSSTAAFLMHTSDWDLESEAYLTRVVAESQGRGCGGVPSAFPSTHFDMVWVSFFLL